MVKNVIPNFYPKIPLTCTFSRNGSRLDRTDRQWSDNSTGRTVLETVTQKMIKCTFDIVTVPKHLNNEDKNFGV